MCKYPFVKTPGGVKKSDTIVSEEARLASTPFPCGQCLPCRINKSRMWTHRILLEAMMHDYSVFATLTYNDKFLPIDGCLHKDHLTKFLKRLRKKIHPRKIRYFAVGEYGDKNERPHYHLAIFGLGMHDRKIIEKTWSTKNKEPIGFTYCGELNKKSARYITGYIVKNMKKNDKRLKGKTPEFKSSSTGGPGGLGIEAIKEIVEKLKKNKYEDPRIIRELQYGKQKLPLGRYLVHKLAELQGIDQNAFDVEFWEYQQDTFEMHMKEGEIFRDNVVAEKEEQRRSQLGRQKLTNRRRL